MTHSFFISKRVSQSLLFALTCCVGLSCRVPDQDNSHTGTAPSQDLEQVSYWLTNPDKSVLFRKQPPLAFSDMVAGATTITLDPSQTYQEMDGFGYTLTGGSTALINNMSPARRKALLEELFTTKDNNIGVSYLRVSIGASDLDEKPFSYNDLPSGQADPKLEKFSLAPDRKHLIPILKQILALNPDIKIMGSPWSPPTWMKDNQSTIGGSLKPEYYDAYAQYFVKYIQGMEQEGISIDAITIQNEPLHPGNNPSLLMLPEQQAEFIKNHLGPAFREAGIKTKIVVYDHNADRPDYPITVMNDPEANKYIDGAAFHLYGGSIDALEQVHEAHPDKNLYFTEQWIGAPGNFAGDLAWHMENLIIGAPRHWSRTVLEWNLAANSQLEPHTEGGCTQCLGALTIDGDMVVRNPAYYIIAHASKFVRPGSVRIASNLVEGLPNVAYRTPEGQKVLIVLNTSGAPQAFDIADGDKAAAATLKPGAVATFVW
ncbi:glucosylceramidase [Pontibacter ummariensis]|uniref:Glucosylceramidase n=1 Tax=Pontibacter ummariensis TaxID=1610492 RepID=A0A239KXY2_9BACT|nr:glycoside hydrolase family 30 beta sandwich domain-containing protein [Pontibacter ummariensis]PRY04658.1 glucosylceramidase [Pontibacter ummariensis]SNT23216.1 glucosylceramidase [Pontibacter ummariensis]